MNGHEAVVYDLDGTLVDLAVDWAAVAGDVADLLDERRVDTDGMDLWEMWTESKARGHAEAVNGVIADHETTGARVSTRLPAAERLPHPVPVGVCTLNAESAAHEALGTHGLAGSVSAVVGRDSVDQEKPDPAPLLACLEALGVGPDGAVFVGDGERDEETARRAGVRFSYVSEWPGGSDSDGDGTVS
jgi:phosphoglycolate phosphatase